jgi:hypothetical protein
MMLSIENSRLVNAIIAPCRLRQGVTPGIAPTAVPRVHKTLASLAISFQYRLVPLLINTIVRIYGLCTLNDLE